VSEDVALSADGRYVAFASTASNLVPGDTNGVSDVFVRDGWTGLVERVSVSTAGVQADAESLAPHISADGRFVAFASEANNLVAGFTTGAARDVFLRDRELGTTRVVTVASNGLHSNGDCTKPRVSDDGRYVSFEGSATNLVPGLTTSVYQVFRRDMQGGTALVSMTLAGQGGNGFSWNGDMSGDGRYVCFVSSVGDFVAGDTNNFSDCFRRDMQTGVTRRVSVSSSGLQANGNAFVNSAISHDGRWVAFSSAAANLAPGEFGASYDIFLHDTASSQTFRISQNSAGQAANGNSYDPAVSNDGRYVAFQSFATNLDPLDTDLQSDVFLRDRQLGITRLVSRSASAGGNDSSYLASMAADASVVGFHSSSSNLVPDDTNQQFDVFVRDLGVDNHPSFCAGTDNACPCGNGGEGAAGCESSAARGGALLRAFGRSSVSNDEVTLLAVGLPPATSALFFQGTLRENGGAGAVFGDGLRCAGGTLVRLASYGVTAGTAAIGYSGGGGLGNGTTTPIHTLGSLPTSGGTRTYQVWYRNSAVYCTPSTFNLSNGVEISWAP
jgi:Tol biopolymer transport system component